MRVTVRSWPAWWPAAVAVALTSPLALYWWNLIAAGSVAFDWRIFVQAGRALLGALARPVRGQRPLQLPPLAAVRARHAGHRVDRNDRNPAGHHRGCAGASHVADATADARLLAICDGPQRRALITVLVCAQQHGRSRGCERFGWSLLHRALFPESQAADGPGGGLCAVEAARASRCHPGDKHAERGRW